MANDIRPIYIDIDGKPFRVKNSGSATPFDVAGENRMTSKVTVTAHCTADKRVIVEIDGSKDTALSDGETKEFYVYDVRKVTVYEELREHGN